MTGKLTDSDRGYGSLIRRMKGLKASSPTVKVGIQAQQGAETHGGSADELVTVIEVAAFNEFGTSRIPERSFIRAWYDENEAKLGQELTALMKSVTQGKRTREQALAIFGARCVGQIQARIANGVPPPNAPSTAAAKGSSTPLIDTGVLRSSVSYRVDEGGGR